VRICVRPLLVTRAILTQEADLFALENDLTTSDQIQTKSANKDDIKSGDIFIYSGPRWVDGHKGMFVLHSGLAWLLIFVPGWTQFTGTYPVFLSFTFS